jgi:hypothetical protein
MQIFNAGIFHLLLALLDHLSTLSLMVPTTFPFISTSAITLFFAVAEMLRIILKLEKG